MDIQIILVRLEVIDQEPGLNRDAEIDRLQGHKQLLIQNIVVGREIGIVIAIVPIVLQLLDQGFTEGGQDVRVRIHVHEQDPAILEVFQGHLLIQEESHVQELNPFPETKIEEDHEVTAILDEATVVQNPDQKHQKHLTIILLV